MAFQLLPIPSMPCTIHIHPYSFIFIHRLTSTTSTSIPSILSVNILVNELFPLFPDWIGRKNLRAFRALSIGVVKKNGAILAESMLESLFWHCNVQLEPVRELALVASTGASRRCFGTCNDDKKWRGWHFCALLHLLHKKTWECLALQFSVRLNLARIMWYDMGAHTTSFIIDGLCGCRSITIGQYTPSHRLMVSFRFPHECLWHDTHDTTEAHLRAEVDLGIGMHTEEEGRLCRHRFLESRRCLYAQCHIVRHIVKHIVTSSITYTIHSIHSPHIIHSIIIRPRHDVLEVLLVGPRPWRLPAESISLGEIRGETSKDLQIVFFVSTCFNICKCENCGWAT